MDDDDRPDGFERPLKGLERVTILGEDHGRLASALEKAQEAVCLGTVAIRVSRQDDQLFDLPLLLDRIVQARATQPGRVVVVAGVDVFPWQQRLPR